MPGSHTACTARSARSALWPSATAVPLPSRHGPPVISAPAACPAWPDRARHLAGWIGAARRARPAPRVGCCCRRQHAQSVDRAHTLLLPRALGEVLLVAEPTRLAVRCWLVVLELAAASAGSRPARTSQSASALERIAVPARPRGALGGAWGHGTRETAAVISRRKIA